MPTTSNFGWTTPADTDLVKDGAAAIRTLGNGIDTSFLDLKGGTTGQVLAKASNTDLDFTWSAADPLSILDAKGDLISATAADTPARLAVGANDTVLTADSSTATGLKWAAVASGGMTEIASGSLGTGATFTISAIPGTYKNLQLVIDDFYPATSNVDFALQFNGITTAKYSAFWVGYNSGIANTSLRQNDSMNFDVDVPNNFTNSKIIINLWDYASTNDIKTLQGSYAWQESNGDNPRMVQLAGSWYQATAGAITSITVLCGNNASGFNIGGGTYKLFGVK